ncbi:nitric oxide synthase oxygenase [Salimicrobium humidisoli]|uniref:Nitric oxide synthase oxygenase n=1 Tax=Salimicrobium humidisoli TaxID=2029857 RepID=A0ABX4HTN4_9BACI|nr:nitric oxide synthase oxygenase [Salimicrobium humidisoli]PBB06597.1 nitric oxide synthase [Salimicrobium humidisoli]
MIKQAEQFLEQCYKELGKTETELRERTGAVTKEIEDTGSYTHTYEELEYGAKMAWRNSNRCIGRLFWNRLEVKDQRHLDTEEEVAGALREHIHEATNGGRIQSTISIFKPKTVAGGEVKIWNHQLLRYAGYETDGGIIGDPDSVALTKKALDMGWKGAGTSFDILPHILHIDDREPVWYDVPEDIILEIPLRHPEYEWFRELGLHWYAVPIISDMRLEIGGVDYTCAPFNGWYMETEIGARNFADEFRYNLLPVVAEKMGLDTNRNSSLWKDRALLELNQAVLYSFQQDGVSLVDHHTAAQQFQVFQRNEHKQERQVTGDWTWLNPPVSPATTPIFHQSFEDRMDSPNYFYQKCPFS